QNRMARQAEKRSHLDLQVGMLAEQELTAMLQMQHKICQRLGIDVESAKHELKGFSDATDMGKLARDLADRLPGQGGKHTWIWLPTQPAPEKGEARIVTFRERFTGSL